MEPWLLKYTMLASTASDPLCIFCGALDFSCHCISVIAFCCMTAVCGGGPGGFICCICRFPVACCFFWSCRSFGLGGVTVSCSDASISGSCWFCSCSLPSVACFSSTACCRSRLSWLTMSWSCLFACSCCKRFCWDSAVACCSCVSLSSIVCCFSSTWCVSCWICL